ncbi:MAG: RagB/SusD family nutrient uptake outer membrane protein, partial [Bacteroidaceae bacterium]|nr:RagB/SusD family nutrient uptake outer membrane protein [Bacteroidaceae bacterium]
MKKIISPIIVLASLFFAGCTNYLNVDDYFADTFPADSIFANKVNIQRYYNGAVELLPTEGMLWHYGSTPGITGSDEGVSCGKWNGGFLDIQFSGTQLTM